MSTFWSWMAACIWQGAVRQAHGFFYGLVLDAWEWSGLILLWQHDILSRAMGMYTYRGDSKRC